MSRNLRPVPAAQGFERSELPANPWPGAIAIMLATLMVYLDTTVVNLSLPHMAGSLSSTVSEATWSLTSYLAANAVVLPLSGFLADWFGRKRLILIALTLFIVSSLLCGLAVNLTWMVVCRVLQGLAGGVMQPLSQAVMLESFPIQARGKAMGVWSTGIVLAPVVGPVLGGWLTESYSWRWVFFINIPVGILSLFLVQLYIVDPPFIRRREQGADWSGVALLTLGIAAIQIMLDQGEGEEWFDSRMIGALAVAGTIALSWFFWRAFTQHNPVVDLRVFRDRTFTVGTLLSGLMGFLLYGSIVVLPLMLQTLLGYPPLEAGLAIMPRAFGSLIAFPIVGVLADRWDARRLLAFGLVLGAVTMFWFARLDATLGFQDLLWPQFIQGLALGLLFVPLSTVTMYRIDRSAMGNATALYNVVRNLGSSIGIAIVATFLTRSQKIHRTRLSENVDAYSPESSERFELLRAGFEAAGSDPITASEQARAALAGMVDSQAAMLSYLASFRLFGIVFVLMVPFVFLMENMQKTE